MEGTLFYRTLECHLTMAYGMLEVHTYIHLDQSDLSNFRPVSNLSFLSKLLEKAVSSQLTKYLDCNSLLPECQSAYRKHHSTETALIKVYSDLVAASDNGDVSLLALLDLSAAFDTVDHELLLQRLDTNFGLHDTVLKWITSYLTDRHQSVRCHDVTSSCHILSCGVPQGSVLGPLLFVLYTSGLREVITNNGLSSHFYADDSQIYSHCKSHEMPLLKERMIKCISDVNLWMSSNRLKLNPTKTEFMWCSTPHQRRFINDDPFDFGSFQIKPVTTVKLLGVYIDGDLTMSSHINKTISSCFYQLRRLKSVRRSLPLSAAKTVVNSFIVSRIDYCNGLLTGITQRQVDRLQSVLNASAKLIHGGTRRDHVTPLLRDKLHWLKFSQRVTYKLCLLVYKALHDQAPLYIRRLVTLVSSNPHRRRLRSVDSMQILTPASRKKFAERGFSVAPPKAWNGLSTAVRQSSSLSSFKTQLKTELFRISYD